MTDLAARLAAAGLRVRKWLFGPLSWGDEWVADAMASIAREKARILAALTTEGTP